MQYNRLKGKEKKAFRANKRLIRLVCKLLAKNPTMSRLDALREARRQLGE